MRTLLMLSVGLLASTAWADESGIRLKEGPGKDAVAANCATCHSLDYIPMNSPFLDRKGWEATVTKMIKSMGAPVKSDDVPQIVDYLTKHYGK